MYFFRGKINAYVFFKNKTRSVNRTQVKRGDGGATYFRLLKEKTTLAQATLLDPRFKREIFSCEGAVLKKHEQTIVDAITPMFQTGDTFTEAATSTAGPDEPPKKEGID